MQKKFLFVCGCPRSGTSYLHALLAQHPAIALGLERFNLRLFARTLMPADCGGQGARTSRAVVADSLRTFFGIALRRRVDGQACCGQD